MRFVGVRKEPADMRLLVGAGAGFSGGKFIATGIEAALAGAVQNGGEHTFAKFGKQRRDVQFALDARLKRRTFGAGLRVLQIIKSAAIGECSGERSQLKWG